MPLPLPNLDTRRWSDLVDEGRALIPRYAPRWTDHNIHDPGIMLLELFAWLTEQLIYRANRVPERHLRKFLALAGFSPAPPLPALAVLGAHLAAGSGTRTLPAGVGFLGDAGHGTRLPFRAIETTTLVEAQLVALQVFDGTRFADRSRAMRERLTTPLFGIDPAVPDPYAIGKAPACYFAFDCALPAGQWASLHLRFDDARPGERALILAEAADAADACARPPFTCTPCGTPNEHGPDDAWCEDAGAPAVPPPGGAPSAPGPLLPPHHSARTVWEFLAADGWHVLDAGAGEVDDQTRALTLDGLVRLRVPAPMAQRTVGAVTAPLFYVRCRLVRGAYDEAPALVCATFNAVVAEQALVATHTFAIAAGVVPAGAIATGDRLRLAMQLDAQGVVQALAVEPATSPAPVLLVIDYVAPLPGVAGAITLALVPAGRGTGLPDQEATLPGAPVSRGDVTVDSLEPAAGGIAWRSWRQRLDFDASHNTDADVTLEATTGALRFGTGLRGRVPPNDAPLLAAYATTAAAAGNLAADRSWTLAADALTATLLGADAAAVAAATFTNGSAAGGGATAEDVGSAAARAAAALWAHERLVTLCPAHECATLDQLDHAAVLDLSAPPRATTLVDFERIALDIPGTRVRRARAWAALDPSYPCLDASGTVTVVVVPTLPLGRPMPSAGLLRAIQRYLSRRRVLCTRLVVVGPQYLDVRVDAVVRALPSADTARVERDVRAALGTFLDPLVGGPAGRGWPFGRDVYRSEILSVIDGVAGVDNVVSLTLSATADGAVRDAACANLCVPPTWLVASGAHAIAVIAP
jgi:predicted phage baseplate assembly protein